MVRDFNRCCPLQYNNRDSSRDLQKDEASKTDLPRSRVRASARTQDWIARQPIDLSPRLRSSDGRQRDGSYHFGRDRREHPLEYSSGEFEARRTRYLRLRFGDAARVEFSKAVDLKENFSKSSSSQSQRLEIPNPKRPSGPNMSETASLLTQHLDFDASVSFVQ